MIYTFELIEIDTADTIEELCEKEMRYIQEYNSYYLNETGYNMTYGGEGFNGYVRTEEYKRKQSISQKIRFEKPGAIEEHCKMMKKRFEDNPELKQRLSNIKIEFHKEHPEAAKEQGERLKKYHKEHPEAAKEQGERLKKYYEDNPDEKERMSEITKKHYEANPEAGKEHSERLKKHYEDNPDARQAQSEITRRRFEDPDEKRKHGELQKKRFEDPRERQKCSDSQKKRFEDNPELRQAQSERMKERFKTNPESLKKKLDTQGNNKPFDVSKTDGTFIKTFTYQFEALEYLRTEHNITSTVKIGEVLRGQRGSSAGFVFKYK
jgi:hypothetical protein